MEITQGKLNKFVFIHIPKSAGTSFRQMMIDAFGQDKIGWLGVNASVEDLFNEKTERNQSYQLVGGHFSYCGARPIYGPEYQYLATLREPISRAISLHNFIITQPDHYLYEQLVSISMLEAIETVEAFRGLIENAQCACLSPNEEKSSEIAIDSIKRNNIFVNTVDQMPKIQTFLEEKTGLSFNISAYRENAGGAGYLSCEEYNSIDLKSHLNKINEQDIELYKYITLGILY